MIEKYVRYEAVCDICKNAVLIEETNRTTKVLSALRKNKWRIEGKKLTCPDCIRHEKERQEEEKRKMEEERAKGEEQKRLCPKCGCRMVSEVWMSGKWLGYYCQECKEERLDA